MNCISVKYGKMLARAGLAIKAMKLAPEKPFQWASGYYMPIYNDNRMFLYYLEHRRLITDAFAAIIRANDIPYDVIAGTQTAGIPFGMALAEHLQSPFIYVRNKPKAHGRMNRIEGLDADSDLEGKSIILIEDLVSTGKSSIDALQAIRSARGKIGACLSIFSYGLEGTGDAFRAVECELYSILTYEVLVEVALSSGYLVDEEALLLREWSSDPFGWGEGHGFPRKIKEL